MFRPLSSELYHSSSAAACLTRHRLGLKDVRPLLCARRQWHNTLGHAKQRAFFPSVTCKSLAPVRHASVVSTAGPASGAQHYSTAVIPATIPYGQLTIGVPREIYPGERRVALTPANVALLLKKGFGKVIVERGAGSQAEFLDEAYEQAGATLVDGPQAVWSGSDVVLKVRSPSVDEVESVKEKQTIVSFLQPAQNQDLVKKIADRKATIFAMDMIPRISRAQVFDALSSMANIAG